VKLQFLKLNANWKLDFGDSFVIVVRLKCTIRRAVTRSVTYFLFC
jgi:hypothetical protein